ncbi:hypothetical protein EST38_g12531 [Candolleomyces aberdarensis]|uniref:BZIP domain-containing protein n=1 Tax=Candolleomyces aberdarensis TaxID=2316362 RepID=A0A4Q2D3B4_9AGAR|nr:hypothetical protein EST38_g12531 [Candolleomyces aberdarensis]
MSKISACSPWPDTPPPMRSANAINQARCRAKKKAYVTGLERTIGELEQTIGELQQRNIRQQEEIENLYRALVNAGGGHRRGAPVPDSDTWSRHHHDYKRRNHIKLPIPIPIPILTNPKELSYRVVDNSC